MYDFIDVTEVSEGLSLPSEALSINGEYIENQIPGYRTLTVEGREALSPEISSFETGIRDGSVLKGKRYPARVIRITYQLVANSNEEFRNAYNKLASILNVTNAQLIFNDETDKYFTGTPSLIGEVPPGKNAVVGEFEILCLDPFKYSLMEYEAVPDLDDSCILLDYQGT
jgi:predicted phage tail component-like protein